MLDVDGSPATGARRRTCHHRAVGSHGPEVPSAVGTVLADVSRAVPGTWSVEGMLPGGWNEGAWLLRNDAGQNAVLKIHRGNHERVLAAAARVDRARAHGWPTPAWLATRRTGNSTVWVLQAYVRGRRPAQLDSRVAAGMIAALEVQRGLGDNTNGWGEWAYGVVFDDWSGFRARIAASFPRGSEIVGLVDAIAGACAGASLGENDLVHGNFGLVNTVDDGERVWLVDVHNLGPGPVAYDLAEAVLTASAQPWATREGIEVLWEWAGERLPSSDVAICAGSVALSTADAYGRLDRMAEAHVVAGGLIDALARAHALVA